MKKLVNIVAAKDGWILEEIARRLSNDLDYIEWTEKPTGKSKITYYDNYAQWGPSRISDIECGLFTHLEERDPRLIDQWERAASSLDVAICMSKMYSKTFTRAQAATIVISPGVDLNKFTLKKVRIGVIGSAKQSGRKGERVIKAVIDTPGIEWCFTGKGWPVESTYLKSEEIPNFYKTLDYVLITSDYEGGPMCAIEALASGVPLISTEVGWVSNLPHIKIKKGDVSGLRRLLEKIVDERQRLRDTVKDQTWENYTKKHDKLFTKLLGIKTGTPSKKTIKKIIRGLD